MQDDLRESKVFFQREGPAVCTNGARPFTLQGKAPTERRGGVCGPLDGGPAIEADAIVSQTSTRGREQVRPRLDRSWSQIPANLHRRRVPAPSLFGGQTRYSATSAPQKRGKARKSYQNDYGGGLLHVSRVPIQRHRAARRGYQGSLGLRASERSRLTAIRSLRRKARDLGQRNIAVNVV